MRTIFVAVTAAGLMAACSGDGGTAADPEETRVDALKPGEYEITAKVASLRSTDKTTPETQSKLGDPAKVARICVPADGTIDSAAFVEAAETCKAMDNYMRGGRMSL